MSKIETNFKKLGSLDASQQNCRDEYEAESAGTRNNAIAWSTRIVFIPLLVAYMLAVLAALFPENSALEAIKKRVAYVESALDPKTDKEARIQVSGETTVDELKGELESLRDSLEKRTDKLEKAVFGGGPGDVSSLTAEIAALKDTIALLDKRSSRNHGIHVATLEQLKQQVNALEQRVQGMVQPKTLEYPSR